MLEIHTLKENLGTTRKELSQTLYQYEAACRVIARLIKERNQAREDLAKLKGIEEAEDKEESALTKKFNEINDALVEARRLKKPPADLINDEGLAGFKEIFSASLHSGKITSLELSRDNSFILTGGKDCNGQIFDIEKKSSVVTFTHPNKVTSVAFISNSLNTITCSSDGLAKIWEVKTDYTTKPLHSFNTHTKSITSCAVHPDDQHCLFFSKDGSWSLHNLIEGGVIQTIQVKDQVPICSGALHPDGLMVATGLQNGVVMFWDIRTQEIFNSLEFYKGPVKRICYSEKGYHMITLGKGEKSVHLWDLRKLGAKEPLLIEADQQVRGAAFDSYGVYLGMCGDIIELYNVKEKKKVASIGEGNFTTFKFGPKNSFITAATIDGLLKLFK